MTIGDPGKKYLVVPINQDAHWTVAIICLSHKGPGPDSAAAAAPIARRQPDAKILYFDSMGGKNKKACMVLCRCALASAAPSRASRCPSEMAHPARI